MKFKLAVPRNVLNAHQINLVEENLAGGLLEAVVNNFPNWKERSRTDDISGGEIILQDTDMTKPIKGLSMGIHLTISMVSFMEGRDFDNLAEDVMDLINGTTDDGEQFMADVKIYTQMSLDMAVVKVDDGSYQTSASGRNLLEYTG